jgi:cytochrome P450
MPRVAVQDVTICGVPIRKGQTMMYCPGANHFNPAIWGETADDFNPDRWNGDRGPANSPFALETFVQGPRNCIAKTFAQLNIKLIVIQLVRSFEFSLPEDTPTEIEYSNPNFTLRPKNPLVVEVKLL